jgi:hypothetical protein
MVCKRKKNSDTPEGKDWNGIATSATKHRATQKDLIILSKICYNVLMANYILYNLAV